MQGFHQLSPVSHIHAVSLTRPTQDNDGCCAITDLLVLCSAELDHALCCGVCDFDFTEDGVAIVGENDTAHGVEQHLQHSLGAQT